ncbi:MAG: M56 family metallopeptidase [Thermoguttaceae bacterium]
MTAYELLWSIFRAALIAVIAGTALTLLLKRFRMIAPNVHRWCWFFILLVGISFFQLTVTIPLFQPNVDQSLSEPGRSRFKPIWNLELQEPGFFEAEQEEIAESNMVLPTIPISTPNSTSIFNGFQQGTVLIFLIWSAGFSILLIQYGFACLQLHLRFFRAEKTFDPQWSALLSEYNIGVNRIPILWTDKSGPALIRLFSGPKLLFPKILWEELSPEQRIGVLRHELAHFLNRDFLFLVIARLLVFAQWYNPIVWFAFRKMEEATEWNCDDFAYKNRENGLKELIETLLSVHDSTESLALYLSSFARINVVDRVNRLLNPLKQENVQMKRRILLSWVLPILGLILFSSVLKFSLIGKTQESDGQSDAFSFAQSDGQSAVSTNGTTEKLLGTDLLSGKPVEWIIPNDRIVVVSYTGPNDDYHGIADAAFWTEFLKEKKLKLDFVTVVMLNDLDEQEQKKEIEWLRKIVSQKKCPGKFLLQTNLQEQESSPKRSGDIRVYEKGKMEDPKNTDSLFPFFAKLLDEKTDWGDGFDFNKYDKQITRAGQVSKDLKLILSSGGFRMREILLALHNYHDARGSLPPAFTTNANGNKLHSWRTLILPYLVDDGYKLAQKLRMDEPWDSEYNKQFHKEIIQAYQYIGRDNPPKSEPITDFAVIVGPDAGFDDQGGKRTFSDLTCGASNTVALVKRAKPVHWMEPTEITYDDAILGIGVSERGIGKTSDRGTRVGLFDGSVRHLSKEARPDDLQLLFSRTKELPKEVYNRLFGSGEEQPKETSQPVEAE